MEAFGLLVHGFAVLLTWKTLLLMMLGHGLANAFEGPWTGRQLVWRGQADAAVTFDIDVDANGQRLNYAISLKFDEHGRGA